MLYVMQAEGIKHITKCQNGIISWKVSAVLLNGWILPASGVASRLNLQIIKKWDCVC